MPRDLDPLAAMARETRVTVPFSIITLDPTVWLMVEPGTPPPAKRLEVLRRLVDAGVPCGVYLAPILTGITDGEAAIEAVFAASLEAGAGTVWTSPLRLAPLVKEHYYGFVRDAYPDLLPRYERAYPRAGASDAYRAAMRLRLSRIRTRHGYDRPGPAPFGGPAADGQPEPARTRQLSMVL